MAEEKELLPLPQTLRFISKSDNFKADFQNENVSVIENMLKRHFKHDISVNIDNLPTMKEFYKKYGETRISLQNEEKSVISDIIRETSITKVYKIYDQENMNKCHILKEFDLKTYQWIKQKLQGKIKSILEVYHLIKHTNLLKYHEIYYDKDNPTILLTMEPLQLTLKQYVQQKHIKNGDGINEQQCKVIISDILNDLWIFHKTGNVHCNIKPSHIMYRNSKTNPERNGWKIIDYHDRFYLQTENKKRVKQTIGTLEWYAPEIWLWCYSDGMMTSCINYGIDLWDVGLLILYILFGHQPFQFTKEELKVDFTWDNRSEVFRKWSNEKLYGWDKSNYKTDKNNGDIKLKNHLIKLYYTNKISLELFDLLHNHLLIYDKSKRCQSCQKVYNHEWFDEIRK